MSLEQSDREVAAISTQPRVTLDDIKNAIAGEYFTTADKAFDGCPIMDPMKTLTICVLVLKNGFTVLGSSAPASPGNFDAAMGQKIAKEDAMQQVWPLMGFALRDRLHRDADIPPCTSA